jgi:2-methylcitrate dehydratase PrpD
MLLDHLQPENPIAAMYSIPFIIGCFLAQEKVGPGEMIFENLNDVEILKIAKKVILVEDRDITDKFPLKCLARVTVILNSGKSINSEILSAKGDPDSPYSLAEMRIKFQDMIVPLLGNTGETLYDQLMNVEHEKPKNLWDSL